VSEVLREVGCRAAPEIDGRYPGQRTAIRASCDEAPDMPTDGLLPGLECSIRGAAEEKRHKLKELLGCA
jgi:hypothetical protein